jgi:hypothetical protein
MMSDTMAFVSLVEARLTTEREAARLREDKCRSDSRQEAPVKSAIRTPSREGWTPHKNSGSEAMRPGERARALDQLARFRAQQAREAAQIAIQRRPELAAHPLDVVIDAMIQAKAQYLAQGLRMDAAGARGAIESAAVAILEVRSQRGGTL